MEAGKGRKEIDLNSSHTKFIDDIIKGNVKSRKHTSITTLLYM